MSAPPRPDPPAPALQPLGDPGAQVCADGVCGLPAAGEDDQDGAPGA